MVIAIDFDGTFAADPELFIAFICNARERGHRVLILTGREEKHGADVRQIVGDHAPIVFAGSEWKRIAARRAGYAVDVFIDDYPEYIGPQNILYARHKSKMFSDFTTSLILVVAKVGRNIVQWWKRN